MSDDLRRALHAADATLRNTQGTPRLATLHRDDLTVLVEAANRLAELALTWARIITIT